MAGRLEEKTLAGVIRAAMDARLEGVYTALPGRVVRYDAAGQIADVQPTVRRPVQTYNGETVFEALPILPSVPIVFLAAGGFRLTLPVAVGDHVLIVFSMRDLSEWRRTGELTDPADPRPHHLAGAVAIPGLLSVAESGAHADHLVLGKRGGPEIHVTADEVRLGSENPGDAVALASKVEAVIDAITKAGASFLDGGTAIQAALTAALVETGGTVGSLKVKAD